MKSLFMFIGLAAASVSAAEDRGRPNVLLLLADDMRADSIAALGNPQVITPNLDTLVHRGVVFNNAYCLGGNSGAVCTPSRNMLLSGNAYFRWKDFLPPGMPADRRGLLAPGDGPGFPQTMKAAGYLTYHHGKRGNTATLIQANFDVNKYLENDEAERRSGEPGRIIVDDAISFLKDNRDPRPWFMYLAFGNPHDPRVAAPAYSDRYRAETLSVPRNFLPVHPFDNGELLVRDERLLPWPRTPEDVRQTLHDYYATITGLDHHIGRLIQTLKASGQLEHTIVIFSADQGIAVGSHGLLGKQNLYEHSMKVPMVVAGPGIGQGRRDALIYLHDLLPTVAELVGAQPPAGIDALSFRPVLEDESSTARSEILLAYRDKQRAIRDARWKLIRYPEVDVTQLFDLEADPDELLNLADRPEQKERVADLESRLAKLQRSLGDDLPLSVSNPKPATTMTPEHLRELAHPGKRPANPNPR